MVKLMLQYGWGVTAALRFRADDKPALKRLSRHHTEGTAALRRRFSRPRTRPRRTPEPQHQQVVVLRRRKRRDAGFIVPDLGPVTSTIGRRLVRSGGC